MLNKELNYESESDENMEIGECCLCGGECNPHESIMWIML